MSEIPPERENPYQPPLPCLQEGQAKDLPDPVAGFFVDPHRRLRTVWRFLLFGVVMGVMYFGVALALGLVLIAYMLWAGELKDLKDADEALSTIETFAQVHLLEIVATTALPLMVGALIVVLAFRKWLDRRTIRSMGFVGFSFNTCGSTFVGFVAGVLAIGVGVGLIALLGGYQTSPSSFATISLVMIPVLIAMAFFEEIVFRSYLLQNLVDIKKPIFGVVFSSAVFCLVHAANPHALTSPFVALNLFGAGLVLALAYLVSGNIWFPTAMHFAWNFTQGVVFGIPVSGLQIPGYFNVAPVEQPPAWAAAIQQQLDRLLGTEPGASDWLTGGQFGFEASAACTLINVLFIIVFSTILARQSTRETASDQST